VCHNHNIFLVYFHGIGFSDKAVVSFCYQKI
jgi:hypothetical protein